MQNTMISNKEREALEQIYKGVDKFIEAHNETALEEMMRHTRTARTATKAEKVHGLLYMSLVKDFIHDIGALRGLLETSEEEFVKTVTEDGKMSLDEMEHRLMFSMLTDILTK